jgi:hypothetical protein
MLRKFYSNLQFEKQFMNGEIMEKITKEMFAYEDYCMEIFLQWLQVRRQQSLNMKFAVPSSFNEGELSAYNAVIRQMEISIQKRNESWNKFPKVQSRTHQAS